MGCVSLLPAKEEQILPVGAGRQCSAGREDVGRPSYAVPHSVPCPFPLGHLHHAVSPASLFYPPPISICPLEPGQRLLSAQDFSDLTTVDSYRFLLLLQRDVCFSEDKRIFYLVF